MASQIRIPIPAWCSRAALAVAGAMLLVAGCSTQQLPTSSAPASLSSAGREHAQLAAVNTPGNVLIADQFNNRVIESDPSGNIVWSFGLGPNDFSARSIIGCNDAQRVGGQLTLMAGTGTPPAS